MGQMDGGRSRRRGQPRMPTPKQLHPPSGGPKRQPPADRRPLRMAVVAINHGEPLLPGRDEASQSGRSVFVAEPQTAGRGRGGLTVAARPC